MTRPTQTETTRRTMSRRRSVAFIPVAIGALLGSLGAVSVSAAPPTTDASEVVHWNQVAASTLRTFPATGRGCGTRIPDQPGHGPGRGVRRSQRDRADAAPLLSAGAAYRCQGVDRCCRRDGGIRRARRPHLDVTRQSRIARHGWRHSRQSTTRRLRRSSQRRPSRSRASRSGMRPPRPCSTRGSATDGSRRPQWVLNPAAGHWSPLRRCPRSRLQWVANAKPFLIQSSSQFQSVAPPALSSAQWATEFNEVKAKGRATGADPDRRRRRTSPSGGRALPA